MNENKHTPEPVALIHAAWLEKSLTIGATEAAAELRRLHEVEKQRDELLAELERFMDSHEECTDFDGFTAQIVSMADYHQAQEAIESVKGEQ